MMRWACCVFGVLACGSTLPAGAVILVRDGRPAATIVVAADALVAKPAEGGPAKVGEAARELQEYVRKISGATLPIVSDDAPAAGTLVFVGKSRRTGDLHVAIPSGVTAPRDDEGFVLVAQGHRLLLAGNDDGPYHGTQYAVYDFLERLGVRWYMPGDYGEYVPTTATVRLADVAVREKPDFRMRNWWLHTTPEMATVESQWKLHNRMNPDVIFTMPGDSSVRAFVAAQDLVKTRPDLFARDLDGTTNPHLPNLSSPAAVRIAAGKMEDYFRKNPSVQSIGIAPDDGYPRDFTPATMLLNQDFTELGGREGEPKEVSTSEEWFGFVNAVAREVKKDFPDRVICTNGYANRDIPPQGVALEPNLSVMYAAIWSDTLHAYDDPKSWQMVRQGQNIRNWTKLCDKLWIYGYDYTMLTSCLTPVPITRKLARDLPLLKQWGVIGFNDETRNAWMECGVPTKYLRARLEWDTKADTKALLADFYSHWYGAAARPAQAFWDRIEDAIEGSPMLGHEDRVLPYVYTPELLQDLRGDIAETEHLADTDRARLHVKGDRLILDHLTAYMAMNEAEWAGQYAKAAVEADRMMAIRKELYAISPFYCLPDERRYDSGIWYWGALDRVAYYRKLADMTDGKTGDLVALLPERTAFRTDPTDEGRFAGWYEPSWPTTGWTTISTTRPFYAQGYMSEQGYPYVGTLWYRFDVDVPATAKGRRIVLFAPAIETEAWAWVNGRYVGHRPYREAYERPNELSLDVTDAIRPGARNVIAVRVNTSLNPAAAAGGIVSRVLLYAPK